MVYKRISKVYALKVTELGFVFYVMHHLLSSALSEMQYYINYTKGLETGVLQHPDWFDAEIC